jgi:hypothetical protein
MKHPLDKIKALLKEGHTQEDVAKMLDVGQPFIAQLLNGHSKVPKKLGEKLGFRLVKIERWEKM